MKRIVVACDGTWVNSDNGVVRSNSWFSWGKPQYKLATPSNVTRFCRALKPQSEDGIQQITFYQGGLGSQNSFWSYLFGGYLGRGIDENIREAYAFVCNNYVEGDEITLVGFSRGAFTARSVGGLISSVGILSRHGLSAFYTIFTDWEHQGDPKYSPVQGTPKWGPGRPSFRTARNEYVGELRKRGMTSDKIPPIKAIGVWDTVGSLGLPTLKIAGIPIHTDSTHEYSFVNTEVAPNVEHAYQALAMDEVRTPFSPTVWEAPKTGSQTALKTLKQTWFPGVHTSVGGGYQDTSIADITLAWMITQLSSHLSFDKQYIKAQRKQNADFYAELKPPSTTDWAMGLISRADGGALNTMAGRSNRTPGEYHPTDSNTGKTLPRLLENTHEFIHPSVRYRILKEGKGVAKDSNDHVGQGVYFPKAFDPKLWSYHPAGDAEALKVAGKEWADNGVWIKQSTKGKPVYIVEETITNGTAEMDLLEGWPEGWKGIEQTLDK